MHVAKLGGPFPSLPGTPYLLRPRVSGRTDDGPVVPHQPGSLNRLPLHSLWGKAPSLGWRLLCLFVGSDGRRGDLARWEGAPQSKRIKIKVALRSLHWFVTSSRIPSLHERVWFWVWREFKTKYAYRNISTVSTNEREIFTEWQLPVHATGWGVQVVNTWNN